MNPDKLKLCFVESHGDKQGFAWFTSCSLAQQWGDDWDDSPYEHNAGYPYDHHRLVTGGDTFEHDLLKVAYESDHETPCTGQCNSKWSVREINRGNIAWLSVPNWRMMDDKIRPIMAGTPLTDFIRLIEESGGQVYFPRSAPWAFEGTPD